MIVSKEHVLKRSKMNSAKNDNNEKLSRFLNHKSDCDSSLGVTIITVMLMRGGDFDRDVGDDVRNICKVQRL